MVPTPLGVFMVVAIQVAAFTVRTAADPLVAGMVWACGAGVIGVGILWPIITATTIRVELRSAPRDATAGGSADIVIALRGAASDIALRWMTTAKPRWRGASVPAEGPFPVESLTRGVVRSLVLEARTTAPIGLLQVRRSFLLELPTPMIVGPRPDAADWRPRRAASVDADHQPSRVTARGDVARSVRPYVPGDPAHLVHWPSSAHAGSLVVREFEPPSELGEAVVVDLRGAASLDAVEAAVSRAAGIIQAILHRGGRVVLCTCNDGIATAELILRYGDAARQLASADAGEPASPPQGWSRVHVSPGVSDDTPKVVA